MCNLYFLHLLLSHIVTLSSKNGSACDNNTKCFTISLKEIKSTGERNVTFFWAQIKGFRILLSYSTCVSQFRDPLHAIC